jgi:class 3 adenylate cyclase
VEPVVHDPLHAGREAVARYEWAKAFELLKAANEDELTPEDFEALAEAAWWTARLDDCIGAREQAFASYLEAGRPRRAALAAMALAKDHYAKGASAIGSAWVNRAERLLAEEEESIEHGWMHRLRSVIALEGAHDYDAALLEARKAGELAARFHDSDLMAIALHDEGRALVMRGDVAEGMALIDEATAPAIAGELTPHNTAVVYCNTITACKELADFRRAGDWSDAAKRWCERQSIAGFPGMCRVYRASIMALRGTWPEAELEARQACAELPAFNLSYAAAAFYELGELRLRVGDLEAAEEAFKQAHELGHDPQPGLALLRLAQGRVESARQGLQHSLDAHEGDLYRARLFPALVEAALVDDDLEAAREGAEELERIAERYGTEALRATAHVANGAVAHQEGDATVALRRAREAVRLWQDLGAPYEAARSRLLLAEAHSALGNGEDAGLELEAAATAFERLGAGPDARATRAKLGRSAPHARAAAKKRDTKTFVFTDIERSTNLIAAIGDEAWTDLVRWHDETLRALFAEFGGEEIDQAGDGFFVAFADVESALDSAVAIQRNLAEHRRLHGFAPLVRIGVHTSEATRHATSYKGKGVHTAARIGALAAGGEILISAKTIDGITRYTLSPPRMETLKGIEEAVEVHSVEWR